MSLDDNYVVRIYRREARRDTGRRQHDHVALTGTVEHAGSGTQTAFQDIEQLWTALAQPGKGAPKARRRPA